jgi:hypothetical protein
LLSRAPGHVKRPDAESRAVDTLTFVLLLFNFCFTFV